MTPDNKADFEYDLLGRRKQLAINNKLIKNYAYDNNSRLTELKYTWGNKPEFLEKLSYNAVNNIIQKEEADGATEYDYDTMDQLTQAKSSKDTEQFYYDKAGNHLFDPANPATYSPTNAIVSNPANQATYTHFYSATTSFMNTA